MFKDKSYMIIGMARSGIASAKVLKSLGARVIAYDAKSKEAIGELYDALLPFVDEFQLGVTKPDFEGVSRVVVSPGVPLDLPFFKEIHEKNIPVIGEIELAYELSKGTYIGITGTNGKTTTTTLLGEMYKVNGSDARIVGNIGEPAVLEAMNSSEETCFITELSSFQLESIHQFSVKIGAILNITPDHLNRHKTMGNYARIKARIFENQKETDYAVLNYDDELLRGLSESLSSEVWFFSLKTPQSKGAFVEAGTLVIKNQNQRIDICQVSELKILGDHNVENALAASLMAYLGGVSLKSIQDVLRSFTGVAHRIEWVASYKNRFFYNDSKATNPESSIRAVKAMKTPTILIAGGMDKGSQFDELFEAFDGKIKGLVILGETKRILLDTANKCGFSPVYPVETMEDAVKKAFELSGEGDAILLSPACASWDMYDNFEVRGDHFKRCVKAIIEE